MKKTKRVLAILIALLLISLSTSALAEEVTLNLDGGDITIEMKDGTYSVTINQQTTKHPSDTSFTVTQTGSNTATGNTLTIKAAAGQTAKVTLSGVNIDVSTLPKAAVSTDGGGDVIIELDGENTLKSGNYRAGLEKNNDGSLTIANKDKKGKLTATGGNGGAGIGGGPMNGSGSDITISGGEVNATGGNDAAGVGGGLGGSGSDITISGGEVKATGGKDAAGIGGGLNGSGRGITIYGGEVTATGGYQGAGIGGGYYGHGNNIAISGGEVTATGGDLGAGIGGGSEGNGSGITISGGEVNATGGIGGAGIGGGHKGSGNNIAFSGKVKATVQGGVGGNKYYGAGAGIGNGGSFSNGNPVNGTDLHLDKSNLLDVSGLEAGAIIRCYKQGTVIPDSLLYEIPELPGEAELTYFVKSRVIAIPDNMSNPPEGVTFNTASPVTFDDNNTTANLLYSFTVTGTPGAEVTITDNGANFYNNNGSWDENSITVTLPTAEQDATQAALTLYGYKEFSSGDISGGKLKNTAKATAAANSLEASAEVEAEGQTGPAPSENPNPSPSTEPSPTPTPTPTPGGNGGGGYYHPDPTPVPVIVIPPKTGDMTVWQSILHFLGIK